jgi:hypothetical protein
MRRTLLAAVALLVLALPAAAHADPPVCQPFSGLVISPGASRSFDAPCGTGTYTLTSDDPASGSATVSGTTLTYTAAPDFHGYDSFAYTATNGDGTSQGSISLAVDRAPECRDTSATIIVGATLTLAGDSCTDADRDDYMILVDEDTPHGSVTFFDDGSDPIYTPDPGFVGVDTVSYFAEDSFGADSLEATLRVTVAAAPAATPTPIPTPPPKDTRAPVASLASVPGQKLKQVLSKGLRLTLSSNEAGSAAVTVSVDAKTARKLHIKPEVGRARATVRAGKLELTVKLAAKARKAFKKLRKVTLTVRTVVTDAAGNAAPLTKTVTLKR